MQTPFRSSPIRVALLHALLATTTLATAASGQHEPVPTPAPNTEPTTSTPQQPATPGKPAEPHFLVRRYPQDRDAVIALVGDRTLTLGDLVDHLDAKHHPGFRTALEQRPEVQRMLQSDLIAPWVRQFADIEALRQSTNTKVDDEQLVAAQSAALKSAFQSWLDAYTADRRAAGRPTELSQRLVNSLLADFQLRSGLAAELQGWLDHLEPDDYTRAQMQTFFTENARAFGGRVNIAHLLIQHRDAGTGILLREEGVARATAKLADIRARLQADGSNFEEVARLYSEDGKTASQGGKLFGVHRFDDRLPGALCRAAWSLQDGEVSDVVESQYGWHLIKRIDFDQQVFILFTEDAIPTIRSVMHRARQEARLYGARSKAKVDLRL